MEDDLSRAVESLENVYRSLFPSADGDPLELPTREGKAYALTHAAFAEKKGQLSKVIAAIANRTTEVGYVVCRGGAVEADLVDGAVVDDAVRATVYPHVPLSVTRQSIDGRTVDFIVIGPSRNRPHLMRNGGGEMIIPFRGAANNITAGRHEIDAMYEDRFVVQLRRNLQRLTGDLSDPVEDFLAQNDWGGLSETSDPEFVFAVVPQEHTKAPLLDLIQAPDAHARVQAVWSDTIRADGDTDWFTLHGSFVTGFHDDYLEAYQPARDDHRIGTIRMYDSGAIVTRIWILEPSVDGQKMYSFNHFKTALRASLRFAWRLYQAAQSPTSEVEVRCALANAEDLDLWIVPSANPRKVLPNRDVGRRLFLPKRPVTVDPHELEARAADVSEQVGRVLKSHYGS
jgi:hypothetical protein